MDWCNVPVKMPLADLKSVAASDRISSWTPLKPQHSNPNPNPLANHLWCIDFLTPRTPLIIPHRLPAFLESLMPLKNSCSIHARWSKIAVWSIPYVSVAGFSKFKAEFYCISFFHKRSSSSMPLLDACWCHFWNLPGSDNQAFSRGSV